VSRVAQNFLLYWIKNISPHSIHATCFHPDAVQLIVGAGDKVLVYDAADGNLIDTLKGKKTIFFSYDQ
jgi:hypothetical protein